MPKKKIAKKQAKERIEKLKKLIDSYRYHYHVLDKPLVSDEVSDSLKHELQELENQYPDLKTTDSPTQRVGGEPLDKFEKVEHSQPMLSLRDAFNFRELKEWQERNERLLKKEITSQYFSEAKMDGLAVSLVYEKGVLKRGATRGNGRIGEDVTKNLKTIDAIPLKLRQQSKYFKKASQGKLEVRGEVYLSKNSFNKLNQKRKKEGLPLFANPRNAAAGSIRQLDPKIAARRDLSFVAYELVSDLGQKKHHQEHEIAKDLGFKIVGESRLCQNLKEVRDFYQQIADKRDKLSYQIDGVVVVIDDNELFGRLGVVGKAPRGMIAYKFAPEEVTTRLKDIEVQIGRTGKLTPVAILKPAQVAGSTVSRATLHNQDEIERKDVKSGDTVVIRKAGDVIPEVVKPIKELRPKNSKNFKMPKKCPICGGKVTKKEDEVDYYCLNKNCFIRVRRQLGHFISKGGFDIDGLGPKILKKLIDEGLVNNPADIFRLKKGDLEPLERFAEKSAQNIIDSINSSKKIPLARFIYSLGIRHVGEETSFDLAQKFRSIDKLSQADFNQLIKIPDIGEEVARSIEKFFKDKKNLYLIKELKAVGVKIIKPKISHQLEGKSFVFTGSLADFSREEAEKAVRDLGGDVNSSVSAQTDFVVVGKDPGSKLKKAQKNKIKIISEKDFKKMIG